MAKTKFLFFFFGCFVLSLNAQQKINGQVIASEDVDRIHVLNKTFSKYTVTDERGFFEIEARLQDTLSISGIKYKPVEVVITQDILSGGLLQIQLAENINELDEVTVGKVLSGNLESDIANSDAKRDIDFYDLGIPGYTGKRKTQVEARLHDADHGTMLTPTSVNINKLLNAISGRTKRLKMQVALEYREKCMQRYKSEFSKSLFDNETLDETLQDNYFNSLTDDPDFEALCKQNDDLKSVEFLLRKLKAYKANLNSEEKN
ncbi:hypothetical protein Q2T40_14965 [Winogradskyella maritima]|uniref:Carboxypeptidase-like regulatory domain-containing protein n=1 Tax=Winogradskyella maritima TaxID=1517766 RepID=A0ABV8AFV7_9FLAO|nr:hypothetical protein [Winogradskyella maritima]